MMLVALGTYVLLIAAGALIFWHAAIGMRAWYRAHRRPRLRLVARSSQPRWLRSGSAAQAMSASPRGRSTARRRRVEVAYLRCISGGAHVASNVASASMDIATGQESSRRR